MLEASHKQRYARQILLAEIGERGQARLCTTEIHLPAHADPRAAAIASAYLERAGLRIAPHGATEPAVIADLPDAQRVSALAADGGLEEAAAALAGAFAAVEAIKLALGVGARAELGPRVSLRGGAR